MRALFNQVSRIDAVKYQHKGREIRFDMLREDALHPIISGNKVRKLSLWIEKYFNDYNEAVLSFGGPFSNHLSALAFVCHELNIRARFLVRDTPMLKTSATMRFCREMGAEIDPMPFGMYRMRNDPEYLDIARRSYRGFLVIPEGGSGPLGVKGVKRMVDDRMRAYDHVYVSVGTGATLYGMGLGLFHDKVLLHGVGAVPEKYLDQKWKANLPANTRLHFDYLFGGYGQIQPELQHFIQDFYEQTGILLDPVYTAKTAYALCEQHQEQERYLMVHTGGLQGFLGMLQHFPWVEQVLPQALVEKL